MVAIFSQLIRIPINIYRKKKVDFKEKMNRYAEKTLIKISIQTQMAIRYAWKSLIKIMASQLKK